MYRKLIDFLKKIESFFSDIYYQFLWHCGKKGLNNQHRDCKIIVSLTTFPGRINIVHKTIRTLLMQKRVRPDKIELWLAEEQFPLKELPTKLVELEAKGMTICWTSDIRSYKKLIPSLGANDNDIIVTCDDDVYYRRDWLSRLYNSYLKYPKDIHCHRATKFYLSNNAWIAQGGGRSYYREGSYLNKLVGVGGVLYPPHSLHPNVGKKEIFMNIAQTNDDIWFWLMAVLNNTKIRVVAKNQYRPADVWGSESTSKLSAINDHGEMLFWKQFSNILELYPEIEVKLKKCFDEENNTINR